jgi:hypothetical protein
MGLVTCVMTVMYILRLRTKMQAGEALNVPAFGFWALSVLSLCPMAFLGKDFAQAFLAPVTWHWFQYIGLNYRLVKNKYAGERKADLVAAQPIMLFFAICLLLVSVNLGLGYASKSLSASFIQDIVIGLLIGLVNCHYFLDAFIWRFREEYPRKSILPYLKVRTSG